MAYFAFILMANRGVHDYDRDRVVVTDPVHRNCNDPGRKQDNALELELILFPVYSSYCCFVDGRGFQDSHPSALEHAFAGPGSRIGAKFKTYSHSSCADLRPIHCVCAYTFVWQLALVRNSVGNNVNAVAVIADVVCTLETGGMAIRGVTGGSHSKSAY